MSFTHWQVLIVNLFLTQHITMNVGDHSACVGNSYMCIYCEFGLGMQCE